ncbi:MAG: hypothetical protein IAG10_06120 [Planctomycetaceae bacterium]|nr:hypothetical protein [Planctomycetaceae bacterium]
MKRWKVFWTSCLGLEMTAAGLVAAYYYPYDGDPTGLESFAMLVAVAAVALICLPITILIGAILSEVIGK